MGYFIATYVIWVLMIIEDVVFTGLGFEGREDRMPRWKCILWMALTNIPLMTIKFLNNANIVLCTGMTLTMALSTVLWMHFCLQGSLWRKIFYRMMNIAASFLGELFVQLSFYEFLVGNGPYSYDSPEMFVVELYTSVIVLAVYILCLLVHKALYEKMRFNGLIWLVFSAYPASQILILMSTNRQIYDGMNISLPLAGAGVVVGAIADILMVYILIRQQKTWETQLKLSELSGAWEIEKKHYEEIESRREEFSRLRHDLKNHYLVMQELLKRRDYEKVGGILEELSEHVLRSREYVYCADPVVNAVMGDAEHKCQEKGISFRHDLQIFEPLKLEPLTVCSLFSNLTRNAVAAAEKVAGTGQEAYVSIRAAVQGEYLHVILENSMESTTEKGASKSSRESTGQKSNGQKKKEPQRKHYGMEILQNIADTLDGQMTVTQEEGRYRIEISVADREKK